MKLEFRHICTTLGIILLICASAAGTGSQTSLATTTPGMPDSRSISIDTIPPHCINEVFQLSGTARLPPGTALRVSIVRGSFSPGIPPQRDPWYNHLEKETHVTPDPVRGNSWTYTLNTSGSYPDEYLVYVETCNATGPREFAIFELNAECNTENNSTSAGDSIMNLNTTITKPADIQKKLRRQSSSSQQLAPVIALGLCFLGIGIHQRRLS